jgi:bacillithiol system protein YtxJ
MFHTMKSSADFAAALEASHKQPVVLFKHSDNCPFSGAAQIEVAHAKHDLEIYGITVQYTPELKVEIAEKTGVKHSSPQAILLHKGVVVSHYYRSEIKERTLRVAIKALLSA